jgi:hypothetical protein
VRNDIDEAVIGHTFAARQIEHMQRAAVPSDTRTLEVIPHGCQRQVRREARPTRSARLSLRGAKHPATAPNAGSMRVLSELLILKSEGRRFDPSPYHPL